MDEVARIQSQYERARTTKRSAPDLGLSLCEGAARRGSGGGRRGGQRLLCSACQGPPVNPVTASCGHTSCRACSGRECPRCGRPVEGVLRDNVLVKAAVDKWWPFRVEAARLGEDVQLLVQHGFLEIALEKLDNALRVGQLISLLYHW